MIPASGQCVFEDVYTQNHPLRVTTHELGHAFGLEHDFREGIRSNYVHGLAEIEDFNCLICSC